MSPRKKLTDDSVKKEEIKEEVVEKKPRVPRRKKVEEETVVPELTVSAEVKPQVVEIPLEVKKPVKERTYLEAVGRRKRASARIRLWRGGEPGITINKMPLSKYFPSEETQSTVTSPIKAVGQTDRLSVTVIVKGGGKMSQSLAVRHGISRVLLLLNPVFRRALKKLGFLTRDPREKERKKFGLKGARRAPQWQKR